MKLSDAFPSPFLSSNDLNDELPATISHIKKEEVGSQRDPKWILYLNGIKKGMVLNVTNWKMIEKHYGDTINWPGQPVTLYVIDTEFRGEPVQGIRVKIPKMKGPNTVPIRAPRPSEPFQPPWDETPIGPLPKKTSPPPQPAHPEIQTGSQLDSLLTEAEAITRQGTEKFRDWRDHLSIQEHELLRPHFSRLLIAAQETTDRNKG